MAEIDEDQREYLLLAMEAAQFLTERYLGELEEDEEGEWKPTARTLDDVLAAWLDDPEPAVEVDTLSYYGGSKPPGKVVGEALGAALGWILIEGVPQGDAAWFELNDDLGRTYVVTRASTNHTVCVFDVVAKRVTSGARGEIAGVAALFMGDGWRQIVELTSRKKP